MAENLYSEPSIQVPTIAHLEEIAKRRGLRFDGTKDLEDYQKQISGICDSFNELDKLPEPTLPVKYPRVPGYRPKPEDNKLNGWYWRTDIKGADSGKLAGKTVAIKDCVTVAGVPMMNGCVIMEGYVPEFDATVVTRVLDAGGRILGKALCESFLFSGSSFTCNKGPIYNFHNPEYSAGGSSGGSATLVAAGEVDLAIGSDQGGSVRLPSSWCGIVGLKPTYGLVPYTGAIGIEPSIDHLGPMARTVHDCALFLEVLAGSDDGLDPRQPPNIEVPEYTKELQVDNLNGLKIGIVKEGFGKPEGDPRVDELVKQAVNRLSQAGAVVEEISIPLHNKAGAFWSFFGWEGAYDTVIKQNGDMAGFKGFHPTSLTKYIASAFPTRVNDLSHTMKVVLLFGEYLKENYPGQFYGRGVNMGRHLTQEYNAALAKYDVVAMPTIPMLPQKVPEKGGSPIEYIGKALEMTANTMASSVTGLPTMSINAGFIDGLPVGTMFTAKSFEEVTLFKVGHIFEKLNKKAE